MAGLSPGIPRAIWFTSSSPVFHLLDQMLCFVPLKTRRHFNIIGVQERSFCGNFCAPSFPPALVAE